MILPLDLILILFVFICAVAAITIKDLLSAVVILGAYSFLMCLLLSHVLSIRANPFDPCKSVSYVFSSSVASSMV